MKRGDDQRAPVSLALDGHQPLGVREVVNGHLENSHHLAVRRREDGPRPGDGDDRMQAEAAHRNVERRQRSEHAHIVDPQRDFFARLAQRRLLDGFARLDAAAGQRHLTAVSVQRVGAHREHDVRTVDDGEHEQKARRLPEACRVEGRWPAPARPRSEDLLRRSARERGIQRVFELPDEGGEINHSGVFPTPIHEIGKRGPRVKSV